MATHSSVLAWRIQGRGSLVGCGLWGRTRLKRLSSTTPLTTETLPSSGQLPHAALASLLGPWDLLELRILWVRRKTLVPNDVTTVK